MKITFAEIGIATLWAAGIALAAWLLTWPLRRRSTHGLLLSLALTCTAGSAGAMFGAIRSMLLPTSEVFPLVLVAGSGGILTAIVATAAARRVDREVGAVSAAIDELGQGRTPESSGPRLRNDLEELRSRLHRTATDLHQSQQRERALQDSRRELVAWMSHDLRAPLAGLRAMAEALEDGLPERPETYYKQIGITVGRLNTMVDDLFDLSRIQAGDGTRSQELVSLGDLVSDAIAAATPVAAAAGVSLTGSSDPDLTVGGSASELSRVLGNVIANAIRHTGRGDAVTISAVPSADGGTARVCVRTSAAASTKTRSTGSSTSASGDAARTPESGRAGLGLAITKGIVEAHGGSVSIANAGPGCRLWLTLPLAASPSAQPLR